MDNALAVNDIPRAKRASKAAKKYAIVAVILGLIVIPVAIVLIRQSVLNVMNANWTT